MESPFVYPRGKKGKVETQKEGTKLRKRIKHKKIMNSVTSKEDMLLRRPFSPNKPGYIKIKSSLDRDKAFQESKMKPYNY
ncbi:hypothetical protein AVEN_42944-1 [Araneus ventricosus]|uniref:Uncharacterized protein n=1 Tax=Araneus ventricosus TaxID=182803 RepID=A0A4Y2AF22_ARAVE|nr:hypothetical protein AVEN_42944-1 [Araneus ventricosus]